MRAVALALVLALAGGAAAHLGNTCTADFIARGRELRLAFRYAAHLVPDVAAAQQQASHRAGRLAARERVDAWIGAASSVESAGEPCRFATEEIYGPDSQDNLTVIGAWTCARDIDDSLRLDFHPLAAALPDWRAMITVRVGGRTDSAVLTPSAPRWAAAAGDDAGKAAPSAFADFFALGLHHIATGYDHLLFLLAVLLAGGGLGRLAAIVTSFTAAHSVTLAAAATGLVRMPGGPVELAIALSIVAVAVENMLGRGADRRAFVTFAFGLVHGLGFAGALAATALPPGGVLVPLVAFNLGVEAGQLAVVAVAAPLLPPVLARPRLAFALSAAVGAAGAAWAVERAAALLG